MLLEKKFYNREHAYAHARTRANTKKFLITSIGPLGKFSINFFKVRIN